MSQLFLLLAMLLVCSNIQVSLAVTLDKLKESWKLYMMECDHNSSQQPASTGVVCNRMFDNYTCWPDGLPNTTVSVPCPWYLPWHHQVQHGMVYQECDANGQWITDKNTSECESNEPPRPYYGHIQIMYTVGYSLSLVALVLALGILMFFRKLHCMRNNIHMNLFASFILRALSVLIKDALLDATKKTSHWSTTVNNETMICCRIAFVMMQYSIMANSYWLLLEGIYLHNLLVITVFTERNYFKIYLCIGWGMPLLFLVPWVMAKYWYENHLCWEFTTSMNIWWIIRSLILLAVVINFMIFIHIIKILVSKLRAHQMRYTDYKFRLAKSTLTLIPLLGIHHMVFIFVTDESTHSTISLRLTKLFIDLFFSSFQGLLVAILYCFVNKEVSPLIHTSCQTSTFALGHSQLFSQVQSEILKTWKRWKLGRNIEEEYRHTNSNTHNTKTGSLLNHVSQIPHLPDIAKTSPPICNPEETHMLVASCYNGMPHGGEEEQGLPTPCEPSISRCTLVEDISLTNRVPCCESQRENVESHM